ncbi:MAG: hypothetical protein M3350_01180, partial [Actinomycetota bacterium]|nr:hypothetical protein [Actinomycetota bacterium]MDQ3719394.1 hypothetical protein [Actinomycetota bacterium]
MAQTKRKRRRKHRGTPAGNVVRPVANAKARKGKGDPKEKARLRREERMDRVPTWRGAVNRAAIAAVIFGVLLISPLFPGGSIQEALLLTVFVFAIYIPLGYGTDKLFYNFRQRRKAKGKEG